MLFCNLAVASVSGCSQSSCCAAITPIPRHAAIAALSPRSSGVSYTNCTPASCQFPCSSTSQTFLQAVNIFHSSIHCQILPRLATSFLTRYACSTTYRRFMEAAEARFPLLRTRGGPGQQGGTWPACSSQRTPGRGGFAPAWPKSEDDAQQRDTSWEKQTRVLLAAVEEPEHSCIPAAVTKPCQAQSSPGDMVTQRHTSASPAFPAAHRVGLKQRRAPAAP